MDDNKTIYEMISEITDIVIGYTTFKDFLITLTIPTCYVEKDEGATTFASHYALITEVMPLSKKASGCPLPRYTIINSYRDVLMFFHKTKESALHYYYQGTPLPFISLDMPRFKNFCSWNDNIFIDRFNGLNVAAQNAEIYCALVGKNIIFKYGDVEIEVAPDLTWRKIINKYKKIKEV